MKTRSIFCLLFLTVIAGCMVGPDYERPRTAADGAEGFVNTPSEWVADVNALSGPGRWWERFNDPVLSGLVEQALENNTDIRAAIAGVAEAEALLAQSHGGRLPSVSYGAARNRSKTSFSLFGTRQSFFDTTYSQDLTINYIVDFFGKLRRSEQAALADLMSAEENRQALTHGIIAQVVLGRVQVAVQQRLAGVAESNIANWREYLDSVERRYSQGLAGPLDVYLAKENFASAQAEQMRVSWSLALAQNSLDVLIGTRPGTGGVIENTLPELPALEAVPVGLPAGLLDRRPDVRAAEMRLRAANERIGVSIASMLPDLTLTASGGYRSQQYRYVSATENQIYSFVTSIAAPIFEGGSLKAGVDAARARTEQAAAEYAGVVLTALREVEDALVGEETLRKRVDELKIRLESAYRAEELARQRYTEGLENVLLVLETERRRRTAENELILTEGDLWNNRVALYLALGGDWNESSEESKAD